MSEHILVRLGRHILERFYNRRKEEYDFAWSYISESSAILDVACGTGTFLNYAPNKIEGLDLNPDNVAYCKSTGLNAILGNALSLPYKNNSFESVHSSHIIQVLQPDMAATYVRELFRVCKPGGYIVLTALNNSPVFWRHPENARPYGPQAIQRLFSGQKGEQSPMWQHMPARPEIVALRKRRQPLFELASDSSWSVQRIFSIINALQYGFYLRKYWAFDAYTLVMRKSVHAEH